MTTRSSRRLGHHRTSAPARSGRSERGASLIIIMAFLLVVMVVVGSLFGLAMASTTSLKDYRQDRVLRANVDTALEIGVRNVRNTPALGQITGSNCTWSVPVVEVGTDTVFVAGSTLTVSCAPHTAFTGTVAALDGDGGQAIRDVDFTVTCRTSGRATRSDKLQCDPNGTGTNQVVGRARVRYDLDYAAPPATRATVAKIITWDLRRP